MAAITPPYVARDGMGIKVEEHSEGGVFGRSWFFITWGAGKCKMIKIDYIGKGEGIQFCLFDYVLSGWILTFFAKIVFVSESDHEISTLVLPLCLKCYLQICCRTLE